MQTQEFTNRPSVDPKNLSAEEKASLVKDAKKYWSEIYDKISTLRVEDVEKISEGDLNRLYQDTTKSADTTVDKNKIITFANFAKRMKKDEFIDYMSTGNLPPVKLNEAEMAVVAGGLRWSVIGASLLAGCTGGVGGVICAAAMIIQACQDPEDSVY